MMVRVVPATSAVRSCASASSLRCCSACAGGRSVSSRGGGAVARDPCCRFEDRQRDARAGPAEICDTIVTAPDPMPGPPVSGARLDR
eukprot:5852683-Prymnesium_polylepis.1